MKKIIILFFVLFLTNASFGNLRINELMQSNITGIIDDLNNFPDSWVELYNDGDKSEDLSDYKIGEKKKIENAYSLPQRTILPGQFVIVYCDKENKDLHTHFRLESNKKGSLYLFKNQELIQQIDYPAFPAPDIAYGYQEETAIWGYELESTPGFPNTGDLWNEDNILGKPVFSSSGGIKQEEINLKLSLPDKCPIDTEIRYTLNGDTPTKDSRLFLPGETIQITKTTIVRASLFHDGWLSGLPATQSYIYPDHDVSLPVVSLVGDESFFYDSQMGILSNPYKDWRRPINIELFDSQYSPSAINQVGECRIHGNSSRGLKLKSLAIYANKRFGKSRLDYEFFPYMRPGKTDYKSIILRNSGNDFYESYMRDAVVHESVGNNLEIDYQAVNTCVFYLNGEYKGILNIRERSNEDNIYTNYDGLEEIHMVENYTELKEGDMEVFNEFYSMGLNRNTSTEDLEYNLDIKEFLDVHFINLFYNNGDFPGNNVVIWRPQSEGGKWRLILKDADYAMGLKLGKALGLTAEYPILNWLYTPGWGPNNDKIGIFMNLLNREEIKQDYIDRAFIYMGDFLNSKYISAVIDNRYDIIKDEWFYHSSLYEGLEELPINEFSLLENVNYMKEWLKGRDSFFPVYFADFYDVEKLAYLDIIPSIDSKNALEMNGISLKTGEFHGYFPVERNFNIKNNNAVPNNNLGWEIFLFDAKYKEYSLDSLLEEINSGREIKSVLIDQLDFSFLIPMPYERAVCLSRDVNSDAGIEGLYPNPDARISIYSTMGMLVKKDCKVEDLKNLNKGIYIIVSGKDRYKISI